MSWWAILILRWIPMTLLIFAGCDAQRQEMSLQSQAKCYRRKAPSLPVLIYIEIPTFHNSIFNMTLIAFIRLHRAKNTTAELNWFCAFFPRTRAIVWRASDRIRPRARLLNTPCHRQNRYLRRCQGLGCHLCFYFRRSSCCCGCCFFSWCCWA